MPRIALGVSLTRNDGGAEEDSKLSAYARGFAANRLGVVTQILDAKRKLTRQILLVIRRHGAEACLYLSAAIFGAQALVILRSPVVALAAAGDGERGRERVAQLFMSSGAKNFNGRLLA